MKRGLLAALGLVCGAALCTANDFEAPVRIKVDGVAVRVETPGYACPAWADLKGDGQNHLLVGQFNGGKIQAFKYLGDGKFAPGTWLQAGGKPAEVPGVW